MTDAKLYSIEDGNSLVVDGITRVFILKVDGETVTLASRTTKTTKTVETIVRWIDRGRAVVCSGFKGA